MFECPMAGCATRGSLHALRIHLRATHRMNPLEVAGAIEVVEFNGPSEKE